MKQIFDVLPINFFRVLSGENREILSECALLLFEEAKENLDFYIPRDVAGDILEEYVDANNLASGYESNREYGNRMIRTLNDNKWIKLDRDENLRPILGFYDYTIKFIRFVHGLNETEVVEYSGHLRAITNALENQETEDRYLDLDNAYAHAQKFKNRIEVLNSSIKEYHQKIFDDKFNEDLNELLKHITIDYQMNVIDRSYNNLIVEDHPAKYKYRIIDACNNILNDEDLLNEIALSASSPKQVEVEEAKTMYKDYLFYIIDLFDDVEYWINEIKHKNALLVEDTVKRIDFMLNNYTDVTSQLYDIVKMIQPLEDSIDIPMDVFRINILEEKSLRSPVITKDYTISKIEEIKPLNKVDMKDQFEKLYRNNKYSKNTVEEIVLKHLKNKEIVSIDEITKTDDILAVLIFIYGFSFDSKYEIIKDKGDIHINNVKFTSFKVRKGEGL